MKTLISILIGGVASIGLCAQSVQTLTKDRNSLRVGDNIVKQQVQFKDPGSCGRNLSWDFRNLQPINEEYSLKYSLKNKKDSSVVCGIEHNTRYYYHQHDSIWATGFENYTTLMNYTQPELRMKFPFQYGDTLFSRFEGEGEYCHTLALAVKGYTRVKADAEGELLLPDWETVKKATRVHTLRYYTETGRDSIEMTLDSYAWYAAGIRYPVFESIKTNLIKKGTQEGAQKIDTTVFSTSFYYPPSLQTTQVETAPIPMDSLTAESGPAAVFTEGQLLPNPVIDNLTIRYKLTRPAKIWFSVHTNGGIPVRSTSPQQLSEGNQETIVPMSGLITGTYSLYVHVDQMVMVQTVLKK